MRMSCETRKRLRRCSTPFFLEASGCEDIWDAADHIASCHAAAVPASTGADQVDTVDVTGASLLFNLPCSARATEHRAWIPAGELYLMRPREESTSSGSDHVPTDSESGSASANYGLEFTSQAPRQASCPNSSAHFISSEHGASRRARGECGPACKACKLEAQSTYCTRHCACLGNTGRCNS